MLSVIVITKNEQDRIKVCLESIKWADELIVYDNGSTDQTLEIAKKYTDKIFKFSEQDFATLRNKAMEKAAGDWVLYVDADERVLAPLKQEILEITSKDEKSAYAVSRINIIFGQKVSYGPYQHDWVIRLFKKTDFETWVGKVHEYGKFKGELGYTKNSFLHLTHRDLDHFILKSLEWSKIDAKLRLDAHHPKMTKWRFLRIILTETWNQGIIRGGFLNGTVAVIDSILQVFSMFITYVRLWEMQQTKPRSEVYNSSQRINEKNLFFEYKDIDEKLLKEDFKF